MATLELEKIVKRYGETPVIHGVDLRVESGEFCVFVGPSGCGKSTLLQDDRRAGGDHGRGDPHRRQPGQRAECRAARAGDGVPVLRALPAHDGAAEPGLRAGERAARPGPRSSGGWRRPHGCCRSSRCSGGGRGSFRVGSGSGWRSAGRWSGSRRSFCSTSRCRTSTPSCGCRCGSSCPTCTSRLGNTMIYVTHDQVEAMTMADRIVVLRLGHVEQVGAPLDLYNRPANRFVAGFIGSPRMNFLEGKVARADSKGVLVDVPGLPPVAVPVDGGGVQHRRRGDAGRAAGAHRHAAGRRGDGDGSRPPSSWARRAISTARCRRGRS